MEHLMVELLQLYDYHNINGGNLTNSARSESELGRALSIGEESFLLCPR